MVDGHDETGETGETGDGHHVSDSDDMGDSHHVSDSDDMGGSDDMGDGFDVTDDFEEVTLAPGEDRPLTMAFEQPQGDRTPLPGVPDADTVRAIEAIVMVAVEPVPAELLAQLLEMPTVVIEGLCRELANSYAEAGHGFQLVNVAGGFRFQSHPDQSPYVERFLLDGQRARMSGAALETLAIVAYKQPISRAQVASIRGVDPDGVLRTLQARGYITEVARDSGPGQAILFGTTPSFLEKLGLASLADLPPIAEFVPGADVVEALEHGLRVEPTITPGAPDGAS